MTTKSPVSRHQHVTLQYSLSTAGGQVIRSADSKPIGYVHGCGVLFPKLEAAIEGRSIGEILRVRLLPEDAFGRRDVDLVHEVPRTEFPPGEEIAVGGNLTAHDEQGNPISFRVTAIEDGIVKLDANHPLAGETLIFEMEIRDVRAATEAEIAQASSAPT